MWESESEDGSACVLESVLRGLWLSSEKCDVSGIYSVTAGRGMSEEWCKEWKGKMVSWKTTSLDMITF